MLFNRWVRIASLTLAGIASLGATVASANVSLRNGNFYVSFSDVSYLGGFEPKIERVYNSKTAYKGMFGWNWGSDLDVYLAVSADGSVVVHEYGGGRANRFAPVAFNAQELDKAVAQIVEAAKKTGKVSSEQYAVTYAKRLKTDAEFRNLEWEKLVSDGKIKSRELPVGTQLVSNQIGYQFVTRVADGYVRNHESGKTEKFNDQGRLVKVRDKQGNFIDLTYGKDGRLAKLVDNLNRKMFFTFNSQGLLEKVDAEGGKEASYKYNNLGELAYSKDVSGNVYEYAYGRQKKGDGGNYHNLVEIAYSDKTTLNVEYYDRDKNESVRLVKDRDQSSTVYSYEKDPSDSGHLAVTTEYKLADGKTVSTNKYEYFEKTKADGERWNYKMITTLDGDRTETVYNECCGLPMMIKHDGEETSFVYDTKGHVLKKTTPYEVTELAYDSKVSKVSKVVTYPTSNQAQKTWSEFQYDDKGNLSFAKNSEGKGVKLFYDGQGRILSMVDQNRRRIDFKYNESSRPIEISDPQLGAIQVSYTNSGEVKKVESTAGRKIAMQVTSAFQNLLDIVRPAGVSLSF